MLVRLFRGEATPTQVIVAAKDRDAQRQRENECVAFFFLGQHRLINDDGKGAVDYFRRTLATGVTNFRQYAVAKRELDRLGAAD
jgi:lipoprotein NlpI